MKRFIYKLERIVEKISVENLILIMLGGTGIFYIAGMLYPELIPLLKFDRSLILQGQVWRVFTFIFIYDGGNLLYFLLYAYFYWWIGSSLESYWGKTRFCTYYYLGILLSIASGFIAGWTTVMYLNFSLFFAYAMLDPNHQILLFFILPIKIKWIAWLEAAYFVFLLIVYPLPYKLAIIVAFLNFLIFFYDDFFRRVRLLIMDIKYRMRRK